MDIGQCAGVSIEWRCRVADHSDHEYGSCGWDSHSRSDVPRSGAIHSADEHGGDRHTHNTHTETQTQLTVCPQCLAFCSNFGMVAIVAVVLEDVTNSVNVSTSSFHVILAVILVSAIVGGLISAPLADKLTSMDIKYYKKLLVCINIIATLSSVFFAVVAPTGSVAGIALASGLMSFADTGAIPVGIEIGTEIVYPLPESASAGYLLMIGNVFAFVMVYVFNAIAKATSEVRALWLLVAIQVVSLLASILFNGKYRKHMAEYRASICRVSGVGPATRISGLDPRNSLGSVPHHHTSRTSLIPPDMRRQLASRQEIRA